MLRFRSISRNGVTLLGREETFDKRNLLRSTLCTAATLKRCCLHFFWQNLGDFNLKGGRPDRLSAFATSKVQWVQTRKGVPTTSLASPLSELRNISEGEFDARN